MKITRYRNTDGSIGYAGATDEHEFFALDGDLFGSFELTGNPYFSTDTAAALRAMEVRAEVILKATKVDGIYDADPIHVKDAKMFPSITYREILSQNLRVMDATAISLCRENNLPIIVFNLNAPGNILRVILGDKVGSTVTK